MALTRPVVLFDLDGTLVDSVPDLATALGRVLRDEGLEPLPSDEVSEIVGDGAAVLVERAWRRRGRVAPDDALSRFKACYHEVFLDRTTPYPGIPELLARLTDGGARLAVVTNKPGDFARRLVEGLGLDEWLGLVVGPEDVSERKPAAAHVGDTLERLGAKPTDAALVGDGTTDMAAGRAAGVLTLGVAWGYRSPEQLREAGATAVVSSVRELGEVLGT